MHPDEYAKMFQVEDTHWWFAGKRRLVRVLLDSLPRDAARKILDVGCGTGGMHLLLKDYGRVYGVDASELAVGFTAQRKLAQVGRAELPSLPFPDAAFDLVSTFDVLYHRHVEDDQAALREISRVLKPRGYLVITDSALEMLRSVHDDTFHGARRYTTAEMREKLRAAGFATRKLSYANFFIFPVAAPWRLLRRNTHTENGSDVQPSAAWINQMMGGLYRVEAGLLGKLNFPIGTSIIALAQKTA